MYERFTDRSRKVMQLANQEAQRFNHEHIGTEHILLGIVKEGGGLAASVLKNMGMDLRKIRLEVEKIVQPGPDTVTMGKLPQTPRARKAIENAMDQARGLLCEAQDRKPITLNSTIPITVCLTNFKVVFEAIGVEGMRQLGWQPIEPMKEEGKINFREFT